MRRPVFVLALLAVFAALLAPSVVTPRSVATAQEPLWQDLRFVPSSGGCEGPFAIEGSEWPPGTIVFDIPGWTPAHPTHAGAPEGTFRLELPPEAFAEQCVLGATLTVRAERLRPDESGARILGEASYQVVGEAPEAGVSEPEAHFEPASGNCQLPVVMAGSGYPPHARLEIAVLGMSKEPITRTTTDGLGAFLVTIPDSFWEDRCRPGSLLSLSGIIETAGERIRADAEYEVASPWRLTLGACDEKNMTLRGAAFPPGAPVMLMLAEDHWFAHNFAILDELEADASGTFATTVPMGCPADGMTVLARLESGTARLNSTVPPASTGDGLVPDDDGRVPLLLAVASLVFVTAARRVAQRNTPRLRR